MLEGASVVWNKFAQEAVHKYRNRLDGSMATRVLE